MSDYNRYYGDSGENGQNGAPQQNYEMGQEPYSTNYYTVQTDPRPPKKKKNKGLIVFIVVIASILVLTLGAFAVTGMVNFAQNGTFSIGNTDNKTNGENVHLEQTQTPAPKASASGEPLTVREIAAKVKPSVVGIVTDVGSGTGVVMNEEGYIITNAHVVEGSSSFTVYMDDEKKTQYPAKLIGMDTQTDVAVIKVDATGLTAAEFGDSDALAAGDQVVAIGNPGGLTLQNSVTVGYVSAVNRSITLENGKETKLIQTDAAINPGNSGGALVNEYGQVIGINSNKIIGENYEGLGFAIPINTVKSVVDELIANGYVSGRPRLGITGQDVSQLMAAANNVPKGVLVVSVDEGSDAYAKGIRAGDIITHFAGTRVEGMTALNAEKDKYKAGDTVELTVNRQGKDYTVKVTLSEDKPTDSSTQNQQTPNSNGSNRGPYNEPYGGYSR